MKIKAVLISILVCVIACGNKRLTPDINLSSESTSKADTTINFENANVGQVPEGFTMAFTGKTQTLNWKTANDNGNNVVAQLAANKGDYYNLLMLNNALHQDLSVSVRIKSVSGKEDQGGGLVWRYLDNNHYYLARYNPLENNFRFYRVVNGNRKQLKSERSDIPSGTWFTLQIEMSENRVSCWLNETKLIDTTDDTLSDAGKIGLWTKADAVSYFDDMTISQLK